MLVYALPRIARQDKFSAIWNSSGSYADKKIPYIKALRECTGTGLKEAKEAIESAQMAGGGFNFFDLERLFLNARAEPDTDFAPLAAAFAEAEKKDSPFILAMRNIEQNWRALNFPSFAEAVRAISANF